jgi:hypothetical protein
MRMLVCFLIFSFGCMGVLNAQTNTMPKDSSNLSFIEIKKDRIEAYKKKAAYDYNTKKNNITWWDDFKGWVFNSIENILRKLFGYDITSQTLVVFFRILIYSAIGLLLFLLLKLFLNVSTRSFISAKGNSPLVVFTEEEEIIQSKNIPELIQKAIVQNNFRLAVRYQYLWSLKQLSEEKLIQWEQQKTNDDYLAELENNEIYDLFSKITRIYDFVWYGNFEIDKNRYASIAPVFSSINQKITMHG